MVIPVRFEIFQIQKPKILSFRDGNCVEAPRLMSFEAVVSSFGVKNDMVVIFFAAPRRFLLALVRKKMSANHRKVKSRKFFGLFQLQIYIVAAFNGCSDHK